MLLLKIPGFPLLRESGAFNTFWPPFPQGFSVREDPDPVTLALKALLIVIVLVWGLKLFFTPIEEAGSTMLHYVNLPFHEAGHIFFRLFGEFFTVLGGSLFQLIMPLTPSLPLKGRE
ncbi:MAG TPA: hypothetical protein VMU10_02150 [Desulfomonilia bacterium]|nr:hypothetical protein [Desulfomonilia bacterium]